MQKKVLLGLIYTIYILMPIFSCLIYRYEAEMSPRQLVEADATAYSRSWMHWLWARLTLEAQVQSLKEELFAPKTTMNRLEKDQQSYNQASKSSINFSELNLTKVVPTSHYSVLPWLYLLLLPFIDSMCFKSVAYNTISEASTVFSSFSRKRKLI